MLAVVAVVVVVVIVDVEVEIVSSPPGSSIVDHVEYPVIKYLATSRS